jgi:hypothetical protein
VSPGSGSFSPNSAIGIEPSDLPPMSSTTMPLRWSTESTRACTIEPG